MLLPLRTCPGAFHWPGSHFRHWEIPGYLYLFAWTSSPLRFITHLYDQLLLDSSVPSIAMEPSMSGGECIHTSHRYDA